MRSNSSDLITCGPPRDWIAWKGDVSHMARIHTLRDVDN